LFHSLLMHNFLAPDPTYINVTSPLAIHQ